jgi:hypothetical protein
MDREVGSPPLKTNNGVVDMQIRPKLNMRVMPSCVARPSSKAIVEEGPSTASLAIFLPKVSDIGTAATSAFDGLARAGKPIT